MGFTNSDLIMVIVVHRKAIIMQLVLAFSETNYSGLN